MTTTENPCGTRPGGYDTAVESDNPLVVFLYLLMRDHLPTGIVEELVCKARIPDKTRFSNDFLAAYAIELDARLNLIDDETALKLAHEVVPRG